MSDTTDYADTSLTIRVFSYTVNLYIVLLWQYTQSPNIQALVNAKQNWYDINHTQFWQDWFNNVFNLETCNEFGFVVWAIILGLLLNYVNGGGVDVAGPFGFGPDGSETTYNGNQNYYYSNFANTQATAITFTDDEIRILLRLQYRKMTCKPTAPSVNKILADILVPSLGPMHVQDNCNGTATIVAANGVTTFLQVVVQQLDLLPRSVGLTYLLAS